MLATYLQMVSHSAIWHQTSSGKSIPRVPEVKFAKDERQPFILGIPKHATVMCRSFPPRKNVLESHVKVTDSQYILRNVSLAIPKRSSNGISPENNCWNEGTVQAPNAVIKISSKLGIRSDLARHWGVLVGHHQEEVAH